VDDDGKEIVVTGAGVQEIRLRPGEHQLKATKGGKLVRQELVSIARAGSLVVKISREPAEPVPAAPPDQANLETELRRLRFQIDQLLAAKDALDPEKQKYLQEARREITRLLEDVSKEGATEKASPDAIRARKAQLQDWQSAMQKLEGTNWD